MISKNYILIALCVASTLTLHAKRPSEADQRQVTRNTIERLETEKEQFEHELEKLENSFGWERDYDQRMEIINYLKHEINDRIKGIESRESGLK